MASGEHINQVSGNQYAIFDGSTLLALQCTMHLSINLEVYGS